MEVGSWVDCVKTSLAYSMATWAKGEITQIYGKSDASHPNLGDSTRNPLTFNVKYYMDTSVIDKTIKADSEELAPFNTKTAG